MPKRAALAGKYSKDYFNRKGELKHIRHLKNWSLKEVLQEKYKMSVEDAEGISSFLLPMLEFSPGTCTCTYRYSK